MEKIKVILSLDPELGAMQLVTIALNGLPNDVWITQTRVSHRFPLANFKICDCVGEGMVVVNDDPIQLEIKVKKLEEGLPK